VAVHLFLKSFRIAENLDILEKLLASILLPFLWRGITNDSFHIRGNYKDSKEKAINLRGACIRPPRNI